MGEQDGACGGEEDQGQQRGQKVAFAQDAQGIRVARAALPASEGVRVEAVRHERDTHRLLAREVADPGPAIQLPLDGPWEDRVYTGPFGPTKRLVWPVRIAGTPLFWERPAERAGSATPTFTF